MNWKIGQKLVCVDVSNFRQSEKPKPICGEVVTYDGVSLTKGGFVYLKEYAGKADTHDGRMGFAAYCFRPLLGESAKSELLASFTEVTETSDLPIRVPQTEGV